MAVHASSGRPSIWGLTSFDSLDSYRVGVNEPYQQPSAALLGSHLNVSGAFRTNSFPLKIMMHRIL